MRPGSDQCNGKGNPVKDSATTTSLKPPGASAKTPLDQRIEAYLCWRHAACFTFFSPLDALVICRSIAARGAACIRRLGADSRR